MPHLRLETSFKNINNSTFNIFFSSLHQFICKHTSINLNDCKSRVYISNYNYIGDKTCIKDFIILEIMLFSDRPQVFKKQLGTFALQELYQYFHDEIKCSGAKPAVKITEMEKNLYFK